MSIGHKSAYSSAVSREHADEHTELLSSSKGVGFLSRVSSRVSAMVRGKPKKLSTAIKKSVKAALLTFISALPSEERMLAAEHETIRMPRTETLLRMASMSYISPEKSKTGDFLVMGAKSYEIVFKTSTLTLFKYDDDFLNPMVIVAVRGTKPTDIQDLRADATIPFCKLNTSERFWKDSSALNRFKLENQKLTQTFIWIGTGHSLGGAIIDEFLKLGLIEQAVTFNPADCRHFYGSMTNKRIYMNTDPLFLSMGRKIPNRVEIATTDDKYVGVLGAHFLVNFNNRMSSSPQVPTDEWWKR